MEYVLSAAAIIAIWGGSIWAAVAYTRKALEAAQQVKLADSKPTKRKYVRKAKVAAATMQPATGLTEGAKKALSNGAYLNGHSSHVTE